MQANLSQDPVSHETDSAGFFPRLIAATIDSAILIIPQRVLRRALGPALGGPAGLALAVAYSCYFWTTSGQTPGKRIMRLKVVSARTGALLKPGAALLRYAGYVVSGIPIGLGFFWVSWDPHHDAWHDKIAKTKVIKAAK